MLFIKPSTLCKVTLKTGVSVVSATKTLWFLCQFFFSRTFMHSQLFGCVEGMGTLRTKITFWANLGFSSLRSTIKTGSAKLF